MFKKFLPLLLLLSLLYSPAYAANLCTGSEATLCLTGDLDGGTGTAVTDEAGTANNGTFAGNVAWSTEYPSVEGTWSMDFDGTDDNVAFGTGTEINDLFRTAGKTGGTFMAWIRPEGYGENDIAAISSKINASSASGWGVHVDNTAGFGANTACIHFISTFGNGLKTWETPTSSISLNTWTHVAVVYDGTSSSNTPTIYINGTAQTLTPNSLSTGTANTDAAENLEVGDRSNLDRSFNGQITHLFQAKRLLSEAEIDNAIANGLKDSGTPPSSSGGFTVIVSE